MSVCPFTQWRPITANFRHGGMGPIRGGVAHVQVGYGSLWTRFCDPEVEASSHFWVPQKEGPNLPEQYVDTDDLAWAEGDGNPYYVSIEFEGQVDDPLTPYQLDVGGRIFAWVHAQHPFVVQVNEDPEGQGITTHRCGGAAWGGHSCPGDLRFGQFPELVQATLRWIEETNLPAPPAPTPEDDDVKHVLYWNGNAYGPNENMEIHDIAYDPPRSLGHGEAAMLRAQDLIDHAGALGPFPDEHGLVVALGGMRS